MNYYIIDNKILEYSELLDRTLYDYPMLNRPQIDFHLANPGATLNEVLSLKLTEYPLPDLADIKAQRIATYSQMALDIRRQVFDDVQYINAVAGIYDAEKNMKIIAVNRAFRNEYYRLEALINACGTIEELDSIENKFSELSIT